MPVNFILKNQDIEAFVEKLEKLYPDIKYVNQLMTIVGTEGCAFL